jgi:hypothetical protein
LAQFPVPLVVSIQQYPLQLLFPLQPIKLPGPGLVNPLVLNLTVADIVSVTGHGRLTTGYLASSRYRR